MWTSRARFPLRQIPDYPPLAACVESSRFVLQQQQQLENTGQQEFTLSLKDYSYLSSLSYTLVPGLSREDAQALLPWVLYRWLPNISVSSPDATKSSSFAAVAMKTLHDSVMNDHETITALTQVEYFFVGTDNGHLFAIPLLPLHFLRALVQHHGSQFPSLVSMMQPVETLSNGAKRKVVPVQCCAKRLLHRHAREALVTAVDHSGTLVASASVDGSVALSFFHPQPSAIVCLSQSKPIRCLKLWEGGVFVSRLQISEQKRSPEDKVAGMEASAQKTWAESLGTQESAAIYIFTGDEVAAVRLWRVDVLSRQFSLLHVFIASPNQTGVHSSLGVLDREDSSKQSTTRESARPIYCLTLDGNDRLLAGTDSGFFAWSIDKLCWRLRRDNDIAAEGEWKGEVNEQENMGAALVHPLCWCVSTQTPFPAFLAAEAEERTKTEHEEEMAGDLLSTTNAPSYARALQVVRSRAQRLSNHHVWLREADYLKKHLRPAKDDATNKTPPIGRFSFVRGIGSGSVGTAPVPNKWKPKYATRVAGGTAVGVVCNEVTLPSMHKTNTAPCINRSVQALLTEALVTVRFNEGQELSKDLIVPLCCVEPVVYPLCFMKMAPIGCFALLVLQPNSRVVTSGSDGKCIVWTWKPEEEAYVPVLASNVEGHQRCLGRHLCRLRKPDMFISCGYDDNVVREWHVYDAPELLLQSKRRFTMPSALEAEHQGGEKNDLCEGISCATLFEPFGALFLVGIFESTISSFSLAEVMGCEPPPNYIFNGYKTVKLPDEVSNDDLNHLMF